MRSGTQRSARDQAVVDRAFAERASPSGEHFPHRYDHAPHGFRWWCLCGYETGFRRKTGASRQIMAHSDAKNA